MARRKVSKKQLSQQSTLPAFLSRIPCNSVSHSSVQHNLPIWVYAFNVVYAYL